MSPIDDLHVRLERLERANRRWRHAALGCAVALTTLVAAGFARPRDEVVEAQRFVLVDADGKETAVLGPDNLGNPHLLMRKDRAHALMTLSGPAVHMRGYDGKRSSFLGIDTTGATKLELTSDKVVDGVRLVVKKDGSSGVYVLDGTGRDRATLEAPSVGGALLTVRDERGELRGQLGVDPQALPSLLLYDGARARRIGMLVNDEGQPYLSLQDAGGRPRVNVTTLFDGTPRLELLRDDGRPAFEAP